MDAFNILKNTFKNGGATVQLVNFNTEEFREVKSDHWAVALGQEHEKTLKLVKPGTKGVTKDDLEFVLIEFKKLLKDVSEEVATLNRDLNDLNKLNEERYSIGAWYNDYKIVVEPVELVSLTYDAVALGIQRDQSSIYHLIRQDYVSIDDLKVLLKGVK